MRILLLIFSAFLCLAGTAARAEEFFGIPVILVSGVMMLQGHNVTLWGIDMLAPDQQCWQGDVAWDCGQEAMTTLRHHTEGRTAHCIVKQDLGGGDVSAQCFLQGGPKEEDVAQYLVAKGWARDQADITNSLYSSDEDDARMHGRGVWTSKFQSAEDWKNGVQRFVVYDDDSNDHKKDHHDSDKPDSDSTAGGAPATTTGQNSSH